MGMIVNVALLVFISWTILLEIIDLFDVVRWCQRPPFRAETRRILWSDRVPLVSLAIQRPSRVGGPDLRSGARRRGAKIY
jgi:hypothetical protein